ncbi:MAG: hypothetical protein SWJ54_15770 [Cyanobacteriota bacterium]|nr:hypothetical protein [Cyanobacteriota bacterium]
MTSNKYQPHLIILPEDDANRQIANGFQNYLNLNIRAIQVLPEAQGWKDVVRRFEENYIPSLQQYSQRRIVLLIDFDRDDDRINYIQRFIPNNLADRVFVLGVFSEPEQLKKSTQMTFEEIGEALADNCYNSNNEFWNHQLLQHNQAELDRMIISVKPFLFNDSSF